MEKDEESQGLNLTKVDVRKYFHGNQDSEDSSSCKPSGSNKDPENKVDPTEKDIEGDQTNTLEDVQCVGDLSDDVDDNGGSEDTDQEEDDDEMEYDLEEEANLEFLTTEDELMDTFLVDDTKKGCKQEAELGEENVAEAEREPIVFGVLSEFLPICVVRLDFIRLGHPCYDLRELLKQRLWTQSSEILDQLIILYNLFKSTNTCLQLIECDGAIQFYVHVYELNAIEEFLSKVQSTDFKGILACMLLSYNIREKIKNINAQFSVTCHCENLNQWKTEYERTSYSLGFYSHVKGSNWTGNYTEWPGVSVFNSGSLEGNKVPKVSLLHQRISEDSEGGESTSAGQKSTDQGKAAEDATMLDYTEWPGVSVFNPGSLEGNVVPKVSLLHQRISEDSERGESTSAGQKSTDSGEAVEDATMLDTDNRTVLPPPCSNETSSSKSLVAKSNSFEHFPSKCDPSSCTTLNEKEMRRKSF